MRRKVCHYVYAISGGGVESFLYSYFSQTILMEYDVYIITQEIEDFSMKKKFEKIGIKLYCVPKRSESLINNFFSTIKILKQINPDILHVHLTDANWVPLLYGKMLGIGVRISHSHNVFYHKGFSNCKSTVFKLLGKYTANVYMGCSEAACSYLFGNNTKAYVIKNAIETELFKYNELKRYELRKKYKIQNNAFVIGCVGRLTEQKNQYYALEVMNALCKNEKGFVSYLVFVGEGEMKEGLERRVDELSLKSRVHFVGQSEDVSGFMSFFDVLISPSIFEGLGIVNVEAQMSNLRVLASDKVPKEVDLTGNVSFLKLDTNIDEWVNELIKVQREAIDRNGINNSTKLTEAGYTIELAAKKLNNIYKGLLDDYEK